MVKFLQKYFISGLLVWLPIWVTILVIGFLTQLLDNVLLLLPKQYQPDAIIGFHIPGIGVLLIFLVILLTGMIAANFLGRAIVTMGDMIISHIPLVRTIYMGVKQALETLFKPGGQSFRKAFLVEYPRAGVWTVAFQTGGIAPEISKQLGAEEMLSLYVPTTPNPTSGFLLMVPKDQAIELHITVEQALKFVISLGVVRPERAGISKTTKRS